MCFFFSHSFLLISVLQQLQRRNNKIIILFWNVRVPGRQCVLLDNSRFGLVVNTAEALWQPGWVCSQQQGKLRRLGANKCSRDYSKKPFVFVFCVFVCFFLFILGHFTHREVTQKQLLIFWASFAPLFICIPPPAPHLPLSVATSPCWGFAAAGVYFRHCQLLVEYGSAWTSCSQFPKSTHAGDEESSGRARGRVQDHFSQRVWHVQLGSGDFRTPEHALRGRLF